MIASFGLPSEQTRRWCGGCGKDHGAVRLQPSKMCEDCGKVTASLGLPGERFKKRWCAGCGKVHGGVWLHKNKNKMCEDCGKKQPSFGLPGEQTKRWCGGCGKGHGAVSMQHWRNNCEDCGNVRANFGLPGERTKRWCGGCVKQGRQNHVTMVFWFCVFCGLTMVFAKATLGVAKKPCFLWGGKKSCSTCIANS